MTGEPPRPAGPRGRPFLAALLALTVVLGACGGEGEPELTFEDRLVELEGRTLTPAEVAERAEVGQTICLLDDQLLDQLWQQLDDEQLDFQDIVIAKLCPERAILYAGHTGRRVTEEAEESDVRTSTTRPVSTTTSRPTTTRPANSAPTTTGGSPTSNPTSTSAPSMSAPTSSSTSTPTSTATSTSTTTPSSSTTSPPAKATTASTGGTGSS